ncbi:MAG: zinc ribbon domain-containing protein, partial [Pirellulales bacterium]|nr:zinc ribbon domain-containing protein [Pirellulales bacterium]
MPIEFRCTQCSKLLRTGDDTAGKQAKCPACQAIVTVPDASQATPPQSPSPPPPPSQPQPDSPFGQQEPQTTDNPFDGGYSDQGYGVAAPQVDSGNPYQAPADYFTPTDHQAFAASGEIRHSEIDFGEAFRYTWAAFTDQLGMCILVAFLCGLMGMVAGYVAQFAGMAVGMAAGDQAIGTV